MTPQFRRSVFQVLVVSVDIGVVIYEGMTPQYGGQWFRSRLSERVVTQRMRTLIALVVGRFSLTFLSVSNHKY